MTGRPSRCEHVDPVPVDLGDHGAAVAHRERSVGTAVGHAEFVRAVARLAQLASQVMRRRADHDQTAVLDVRREDLAAGREQRVVGVVQIAGF